MTAFDRIEQRMPELMADLASAGTPDYFDDMLRQAAATRQRPAWASLERWLPMGVIARTETFRSPSMRPIVLLLILGLLVFAGAVLYVGSRPKPLPPTIGPAANGEILYSTTDGEIMAFDPETSSSRAVVTGTTIDRAPSVSPDGQRFLFDRLRGGSAAIMIADVDGSDVRELLPNTTPTNWVDWSSTSDRVVAVPTGGGDPMIIDVATGAVTTVDLPYKAAAAIFRPGTGQLIVTETTGDTSNIHLVNQDGTGDRRVRAGVWIAGDASPVVSSDGSTLAYTTWQDGTGYGERLHVIDLDSDAEHLATPDLDVATIWQGAVFSPDGRSIATHHFAPGGDYQLAIVPTDGSAPAVLLGDEHPAQQGGARVQFSPDGRQLLATYRDDGTTWLYDIATRKGEQVDWAPTEDLSWQRVAPE